MLALAAFFALTASLDPCGDECAETACHILCVDGCTASPVPPLARASSPFSDPDSADQRVPLAPADPALEAFRRPPRRVA